MKRGRGLFVAAAMAAVAATAALPGGPSTPKLPPVFLNHVYRVLDAATFEAADHSEFLRSELAQFERRTTKSGDDSWTGLYFYGQSTYFELLEADPARFRPVGQAGIALGVEEPGASAAVRTALEGLGAGPAVSIPRPRESGGRMVPWFLMTGFEPKDPALVTFVIEYDPAFLAQWNREILRGLTGISRRAVLERYRAKAARAVPARDPLLRDVTGVTLALSPELARRLGAELGALGYRRDEKGPRTDWIGPDARISVVPSTGKSGGLAAIEMSLVRRPAKRRTISLGPRARVEIRQDGTATFTF